MKLKLGEDILVFAPEMNELVSRWGVYAIPRMWRAANGELVIRVNGEADSADTNTMFVLNNLYFVSLDNGETWRLEENGEEIYDISVLVGIDSPYLTLENGEKCFLKSKQDCKPIKNVKWKKEIYHPCGEAIVHSYKYGDIPNECKGFYFGKIDKFSNISLEEINFDFPERELLVNFKAESNGEFVDIDEYVQPFIFKIPYMSSLNRLSNGTLVALSTGQNPNVNDRFCTEVYLVESTDNGKTWRKKATIATDIDTLPYGFGGDGGEVSLTVDSQDNLYCVMRMDLSIHPDFDKTKCWGCMFSASFDKGETWSEPKEIADSSITPHIVTLKDDVLLVVYGRPGVHCKVSFDKGNTWSDSYSIIGKTLTEERNGGKSDAESKYFDTSSYSNTFVEKISDSEVLVCYNNLKYPDKNGVNTKAVFVKKISLV